MLQKVISLLVSVVLLVGVVGIAGAQEEAQTIITDAETGQDVVFVRVPDSEEVPGLVVAILTLVSGLAGLAVGAGGSAMLFLNRLKNDKPKMDSIEALLFAYIAKPMLNEINRGARVVASAADVLESVTDGKPNQNSFDIPEWADVQELQRITNEATQKYLQQNKPSDAAG